MANYKPVAGSSVKHLPNKLYDAMYPNVVPASSASADTFGAWVETHADVGTGKVLLNISVVIRATLTEGKAFQFEVSEGAAASEVVVARVGGLGVSEKNLLVFQLYRKLTDNARIAVRVKDELASAINFYCILMISDVET